MGHKKLGVRVAGPAASDEEHSERPFNSEHERNIEHRNLVLTK